MTQYIEPSIEDHMVCVNISKTFDAKERMDNYDRARHYWRLDVNCAEKANLVLATVHGIVVAVFHPTQWYKSKIYKGKTERYEFEGIEIEDSPYLGKCVWNIVNPKSQNPVSYINL